MDQEELEQKLSEEKSMVVVDFYADWCGPCKKLMPFLEDIVSRHRLCLLKVDIDESVELADKHNVITIPTLLFYKNGKLLDRLVSSNENELSELVDKLLVENP